MRGLSRLSLWTGLLFGLAGSAQALTPGTVTPLSDGNQLVANGKALPYIILVPGALGSKIDACKKLSDECRTVWGDVIVKPDDFSLIIDDAKDDYRLSLISKLAFVDIYEPISTYIKEQYKRFRSDRYFALAYDWRRSVGDGADLLQKKICAIADQSDPNARFVLIGHSMGGLVIKQWMRKYAAVGCARGTPIQIDRAVFVATPHLGAARVLDAVVDGYSLFASNNDGFVQRMFADIGDSFLAKAIDEGGLTFKSTFDLLPLSTSAHCRSSSGKPLNTDLGVLDPAGRTVDIFDRFNWEDMGMLNGHGDASAIQALLPRVEEQLTRAATEMCDLRNFDPGTVANEVTYVVAQTWTKSWGKPKVDQQSTTARVTLLPRKNKRPSVKLGLYAGDGTVDVRSAANDGIASTPQVRFANSGHMSAINSDVVRKIVDEVFSKAEREAAETAAASGAGRYVPTASERAAANNAFIPWNSNPVAWSSPGDHLADTINTGVTDELGIQGADAYRLAKHEPDPIKRLALYSLSAKLNQDDPLRQGWSFTRAAHLSFELGDYESAVGNAQAGLKVADKVTGPDAALMRSNLRSTLGAARIHTGGPAQ